MWFILRGEPRLMEIDFLKQCEVIHVRQKKSLPRMSGDCSIEKRSSHGKGVPFVVVVESREADGLEVVSALCSAGGLH